MLAEYVDADKASACGARPGLYVVVLRGKALGSHVPAMARVWSSDVLGPRFSYVLVIEPRQARDIPDEGFRAGVAALMKQPSGELVVSAAVVPAGLVGATVRGVLTGLSWLSGDKQQIFSSLQEASAAIAVAHGVSTASVVADIMSLRSELD